MAPTKTQSPPLNFNALVDATQVPLDDLGLVLNLPPAIGKPIGIDIKDDVFKNLIARQEEAIARVFTTLAGVTTDLKQFFPRVQNVLPPRISGILANPDGSPAGHVSVSAEPPVYAPAENVDGVRWSRPSTVTDNRGAFSLVLPRAPIPQNGLTLLVRGETGHASVTLKRTQLIDERVGVLRLTSFVSPLHTSVLASLVDALPMTPEDVADNPYAFGTAAPQLTLGECDCAQQFRSNRAVIDAFSYSLLVRLTEPLVGPPTFVLSSRKPDGRKVPFPAAAILTPIANATPSSSALLTYYRTRAALGQLASVGDWDYVDRIPVAHAIDVTNFKNGIETNPVEVPKAATLSLGYIVGMRQLWIPTGYLLGDLLYSLPLAPGERQQVAVIERTEELSTRETESLSDSERQQFDELSNSSTSAIFNSAYDESVRGGSSMDTTGRSFGLGGMAGAGGLFNNVLAGVGIGASYGSSSSSGNTSSWQTGSKDFVSSASEAFHSTLGRSAAGSRQMNRVGVRLASASESQTLKTKIVANHNHSHALTMQFWEVLRQFAVTSEVDDIQLVCYVPMELIQWLPDGQPRSLPEVDASFYKRANLLDRYDMLLRFADTLAVHLRRHPEHRHGLTLLEHFAANPTIEVQSAIGGATVDAVTVSVSGTFLPSEEIFCSILTKSGTRVGPTRLTGGLNTLPDDRYTSRDDVAAALRAIRDSETGVTRAATLVLPDYVARSDVQSISFTRSFKTFSYHLAQPDGGTFSELLGFSVNAVVTFTPAMLESEFSGPYVWTVQAGIDAVGVPKYVDAYPSRQDAVRMGAVLPVVAQRVPPILSFNDLLRIESVLQHVVRNTVAYSKFVWTAMTPEERAILLERFTIGVPAGGVVDASQQVPLLNCVANEVIGYFGNSMVMPFYIPPQLAATMHVTSRDVQEALLRFHRSAFVPPKSSITLPARGMLGEAVLGTCNASEKIDLTRFWNWNDSPIPDSLDFEGAPTTALAGANPLLSPDAAKGPSQLADRTLPTSMITISNGATTPAPASTLLQTLTAPLTTPPPAQFGDVTGRAELATQVAAARASADTTQAAAKNDAKSLLESIFTNAATAVTAQKGLVDAENKQRADDAAKVKTDADTAAKALASQQSAGVTSLTSNVASFSALAGAQGNETAARARADEIITALFGNTLPSIAQLATVFTAYQPATNDSPATALGKSAFLKELGLIP